MIKYGKPRRCSLACASLRAVLASVPREWSCHADRRAASAVVAFRRAPCSAYCMRCRVVWVSASGVSASRTQRRRVLPRRARSGCAAVLVIACRALRYSAFFPKKRRFVTVVLPYWVVFGTSSGNISRKRGESVAKEVREASRMLQSSHFLEKTENSATRMPGACTSSAAPAGFISHDTGACSTRGIRGARCCAHRS